MTRPYQTRPSGRPSRQRVAEISDRIVAAVIDAFAEQGVDFSMDQIALAAGISKQAVYRRWPGKTDLLVHALDREVKRFVAEAACVPHDDPEAALRQMAWRIFDIDTANTRRIGIFLQAEALRDPALRDRLLYWRETLTGLLEDRLHPVLASLGKTAGEAPMLAAMLLDLLSGARAMLAWTRAPADVERATFEARWRAFVAVMRSPGDDPDGEAG